MNQISQWKKWPLIQPLISLLFSRKFLILLFPVLASFGFDLDANMQALVILVAASLFAGTTAWEDAASKRAGGSRGRQNLSD